MGLKELLDEFNTFEAAKRGLRFAAGLGPANAAGIGCEPKFNPKSHYAEREPLILMAENWNGRDGFEIFDLAQVTPSPRVSFCGTPPCRIQSLYIIGRFHWK